MTTKTTLLVTGAAGQLGRRVLETLLAEEHGPIVATTRNPEALSDFARRGVEVRHADFDDPSTLKAAFAGVGRALLISTDSLDKAGRRLAQHRHAVAALVAAGVKHIVYTSCVKPEPGSPVLLAPDHYGTEQALAATSVDFTILRNNLYTELLLGALPPAIASGQLIDARGTGRTAYVTREDCARAAAAALVSGEGRRTLDVTGPTAVSGAELASIASDLAKKPVVHVSVPVETLVDGMVQHGLPRPVAEVYASFDTAIARGDLGAVTPTLKELTGRTGESVPEFLAANRAALGL